MSTSSDLPSQSSDTRPQRISRRTASARRPPSHHGSTSPSTSQGPNNGDRHTHRIIEPKPLRVPYGGLALSSSRGLPGRPSAAQPTAGQFSNPGGDLNRNAQDSSTNQVPAERRQSTPTQALQRQETTRNTESPRFMSSPLAKIGSFLDESRSSLRPSHRTPSSEHEPSSPLPTNTIYERHLLQCRQGFPLWSPHPNVQLPESYVVKGVSVGDVGIITQSGSFDYLFNICLPAEHPSNAGPLPEGFVPLLTQQKDITEYPAHAPGSSISSSSIKKLSGMSFESTGTEGAVLALPDGATHEDIRNLAKFREYAALHVHSWYKHAFGICGREIENGELHLVTGCDKTSTWGMAAFVGDQLGTQSPPSLRFTPQLGPDGIAYAWEQAGHAETKAWSPPQQNRPRNQCIFVRSFTSSLCEDEWTRLLASVGLPTTDASDTATIDTTVTKLSHKSRSTLKRIFSSFGPKSSSSKLTSSSVLSLSETLPRVVHPSTIVNRAILHKWPQARLAITHDDDWALLPDDALQTSDVIRMSDVIAQKFDVVIDPSGTAYLSVKEDEKTQDISLTQFSDRSLDLFPFADAALPGGLVESDFTIESLIEILASPTSPTPSHVRLLSLLLSKQTPPRFSALQPVLTRLCSDRISIGFQAGGYEVMTSYWNNPKVQNASWPTTSDALSSLTFFLEPPRRWSLDLWEVRFKALVAITRDGTDLRGIEIVVIEVIKDCITNAFQLLTRPPKGFPTPPPVECERCITVVGKFLSALLGHHANAARIREDLVMDLSKFYVNLIDDYIQLPPQSPSTLSAPPEVPQFPRPTEKASVRGHKKRGPSLTSFMFPSPPTATEQPYHPPPPKLRHPAEIAISLFLDHTSTHILHLSSEHLRRVVPVVFRALAFCASPLPRFTVQPPTPGPKTLEDRLVDLLNSLIPSPSSTLIIGILKHYLAPRAPSDDIEVGQDDDSAKKQAALFRSLSLTIMTSLGAHRALRNYIRRALSASLEKVFRPSDTSGPESIAARSAFDQDFVDLAWFKYDPVHSKKTREGRALASNIDAWVSWSPDIPDVTDTVQRDLWDRINEGRESILGESAGIIKDIYQEFDSRETGGLNIDEAELVPISEALRSLATYIRTLKSPDGSPFIINVFNPGDSPTDLLRSITTLLSRTIAPSQAPLLANILIESCEHVADENTSRIPALMKEDYALTPMSSSWLDNWTRILSPRLLSSSRPQTRSAIIQELYEVYTSINESPSYRKSLAQLVINVSQHLIANEGAKMVFSILQHEAIFMVTDQDPDPCNPIPLLTELLFSHPDDSIAFNSVVALINIFGEVSFTSLSFQPTNQELAVSLFQTLLRALSELDRPRPRLTILQFLMRLRADRDHRVYYAQREYDTNETIAYLASLIKRLPDSLMRAHKDEILEEHVARNRSTRARASRTTPSRAPASYNSGETILQANRGVSQTISEEVSRHEILWQLPETLPFDASEPDVIKNGLRSFDPPDGAIIIPVSKYIAALADLVESDPSWELVSYVLCHLPVQLANKHLFCGPNTRTSIIKLLYILAKGVISGGLAQQTADDCPDDLKLRDLQGLAHHTLSTLISYKTHFDLHQRHLLVEAFHSGLDGQFSTVKCCLHALTLSALELSPSLSKSLPNILEKLSQIMSNPNMTVHLLAFLVMVGTIPSLHASFTEENFNLVFGVALKYLQHYIKLGESPTRSWALSQHVRQQSYVTVYTWFSVLKLNDRPLYIPYITRELLVANEDRDEVDGPTKVCFDWIARNTYGVANATKSSVHDTVLQANIAKPTNDALSRTWICGNSFLSIKQLDRGGWIQALSRRPSGSAGLVCRKEDFLRLAADHGRPEFQTTLSEGNVEQNAEEDDIDDQSSLISSGEMEDLDRREELKHLSFASRLLFHMSPLPVPITELKEVTDIPTLPKSIGLLDRLPVIDTHKVGIMYVGPGQRDEIDILRNSHGSQAYTRFLDRIGKLIHLRTEKDVYTGSLDPDEDGEYAYAWWDDIRQVLFHTATLMPNREYDTMLNNKKRHIGNDYVRIIWNDSGLPYAFDTLSTAFQFVNIVIEPHSIGTISAFSNDTHENEYFRVTVQMAEGMTECTPVGQFKIVSAVNLPHFVRHLSIFADCFTSIFSTTNHDRERVEIKTNWHARLESMERFKKQASAHQQSQSNESNPSSPQS